MKAMQNESYELHAIIKRLRIQKDYTKEQVTKYLEVDVSMYSDYELARRTPDIKGLRKLAELLYTLCSGIARYQSIKYNVHEHCIIAIDMTN